MATTIGKIIFHQEGEIIHANTNRVPRARLIKTPEDVRHVKYYEKVTSSSKRKDKRIKTWTGVE